MPGQGIVVSRSSGGLVTALEPVMRACFGTWVAHGTGTADKAVVDCRDGVRVPPATPTYRLRRVWLNGPEERGYYFGFANEGLWALCHDAGVKPVFRSNDFETYATVNARFSEAVFEEVEGDSPLVLVQDYHFALAPLYIRKHLPKSTIVAFWHIPWPRRRKLMACPWWRELLYGLLASSIVGFQTTDDCVHFLDSVDALPRCRVDRTQNVVTRDGHRTAVRAYPVSLEWPNSLVSESLPVDACREAVRRELGLEPGIRLGIGVDRLDYTKGIVHKLLAIEKLLEDRPDLRGRCVFVQIAEPSRTGLTAYRDIRTSVVNACARINERFGTGTYRPIVLRERHHEPAEVYRFLRAADLCYVGSLHDGMNLVAKEFVSSRDDERGVLVLSRFAGAAQQLRGALMVNPYKIEESAIRLAEALQMPEQEQADRMRSMRTVVAEFNAFWWAGQMIEDAANSRQAGRSKNTIPFAGSSRRRLNFRVGESAGNDVTCTAGTAAAARERLRLHDPIDRAARGAFRLRSPVWPCRTL